MMSGLTKLSGAWQLNLLKQRRESQVSRLGGVKARTV